MDVQDFREQFSKVNPEAAQDDIIKLPLCVDAIGPFSEFPMLVYDTYYTPALVDVDTILY